MSEFLELARGANLIPVSAELMADTETPVAAFQKLLDEDPDGNGCAFLLESAENSEQIGRFSFLGNRPAAIFESRGQTVTITAVENGEKRREFVAEGDPVPRTAERCSRGTVRCLRGRGMRSRRS